MVQTLTQPSTDHPTPGLPGPANPRSTAILAPGSFHPAQSLLSSPFPIPTLETSDSAIPAPNLAPPGVRITGVTSSPDSPHPRHYSLLFTSGASSGQLQHPGPRSGSLRGPEVPVLFSSPAQPSRSTGGEGSCCGLGGPQGPGGAGAGLREKGSGGGQEAGLRDGAGACRGWFSGKTSGKVHGSRQTQEGRTGGLGESPREGEAEGHLAGAGKCQSDPGRGRAPKWPSLRPGVGPGQGRRRAVNVLSGQGALPEAVGGWGVLPGVKGGGRGLVRRRRLWLRKQRAGETTGAGREEREAQGGPEERLEVEPQEIRGAPEGRGGERMWRGRWRD